MFFFITDPTVLVTLSFRSMIESEHLGAFQKLKELELWHESLHCYLIPTVPTQDNQTLYYKVFPQRAKMHFTFVGRTANVDISSSQAHPDKLLLCNHVTIS